MRKPFTRVRPLRESDLWPQLMALPHRAPLSEIRLPIEPLDGSTTLYRVTGTSGYVRAREGVTAAAWATSPGAFRRVMDGTVEGAIERDTGVRLSEPPRQLLPVGADERGSLGSVRTVLRAAGLTHGESASYRIMTDGAYICTELSAGGAGVRYYYLDINDDNASVAVIGFALTREDWQPDRSLIQFQA